MEYEPRRQKTSARAVGQMERQAKPLGLDAVEKKQIEEVGEGIDAKASVRANLNRAAEWLQLSYEARGEGTVIEHDTAKTPGSLSFN